MFRVLLAELDHFNTAFQSTNRSSLLFQHIAARSRVPLSLSKNQTRWRSQVRLTRTRYSTNVCSHVPRDNSWPVSHVHNIRINDSWCGLSYTNEITDVASNFGNMPSRHELPLSTWNTTMTFEYYHNFVNRSGVCMISIHILMMFSNFRGGYVWFRKDRRHSKKI